MLSSVITFKYCTDKYHTSKDVLENNLWTPLAANWKHTKFSILTIINKLIFLMTIYNSINKLNHH